MVAIVSRAGKGSPLTNAEIDANFANLNSGKVETNSSAVIAALGFTPYNATNPSGFLNQAGVRTSFSVTGDLTYNSTTGVFGVNVPVTSVAGKTGAVTLNTSDVSEGANQYFTQARARTSISVTGDLTYNSSTGVLGVNVPVTSVFGRTGAVSLLSSDVTGALGFTPLGSSGGTIAGDLTFSGASRRIFGDFSNGTINSRTAFQTTTSNAGTTLMALPNGTSNDGQIFATNRANPTNSTYGGIWVSSTEVAVISGNYGTGFAGNNSHLPLTFWTGGTQSATLDTSANLTVFGNVTANSDERLKTDWSDLPEDFVEGLAQVKTGTYTRIDSGIRQVGVSAQSLQAVSPEGVLEGEHLSVAYGHVALAACVKLAQRVVELERKLAITNQNIAEVRGQ